VFFDLQAALSGNVYITGSATTTVSKNYSFWVVGVTLAVPSGSGAYVEIVSVNIYQSGQYWAVDVTCSVTSDGDSTPITIDTDLTNFFQVDYLTMNGYVLP